MKKILSSFFITAALFSSMANSESISDTEKSKFSLKDNIETHIFKDPTLQGVNCNITFIDKALSSDNTMDSSISCHQVSDTIVGDYKKHESYNFYRTKNFFFKTMKIERFYNANEHSLIYVSYIKKVKGQFENHSISNVHLLSKNLK